MANPQREDGKVQYELERPALSFRIPASNRQKKLLRFFDVPFSPKISAGAAGWETAAIMSKEGSEERWSRYLFLTRGALGASVTRLACILLFLLPLHG